MIMAVELNIGTSAVGRAVLCPPPLVNECVLVRHDGAHGVTRPACPNVAKNCYSISLPNNEHVFDDNFHPACRHIPFTYWLRLRRVGISDETGEYNS